MTHRMRGFSLIELMVAMSIGVLLIVLALPSYSSWLADNQVRAAAQSIAGGMRLAYAEAIKGNHQVEFVLDPTTGSGGWQVKNVDDSVVHGQESFGDGAKMAAFAVTPSGANIVTFTGLGMVAAANADASDVLTGVQVTYSVSGSTPRKLAVLVGGGRTGIKICNPDETNTSSTMYCPT